MARNTIDVSLAAADAQAVRDAFAVVLQKLPFLINLTPDERKTTLKSGPDSLSFIKNAATAAQANPTIFPASFNTPAFKRDVDLFEALTELSTLAASVASRIDDTRMAVGGEAMQAATQVYNYVKTAAKTTPGLKPVAEQLGERFQKSSKSKQPPSRPPKRNAERLRLRASPLEIKGSAVEFRGPSAELCGLNGGVQRLNGEPLRLIGKAKRESAEAQRCHGGVENPNRVAARRNDGTPILKVEARRRDRGDQGSSCIRSERIFRLWSSL